MTKLITFEARFDNGHDFQEGTFDIYIDVNSVLDNKLIIEIVEELNYKHKKNVGSYAGKCIYFHIADSQIDEAVEAGLAEYEEDSFDLVAGYPAWLGWFADENDIRKAFDEKEDEEDEEDEEE